MAWFKSHSLFYSVLIALGIATIGEGWLLFNRQSAARKAELQLGQMQRELQAFTGVEPFPSEETVSAIEATLAQASGALAALQAELKGRGDAAAQIRSAQPPAAPTDAFFDLASFVEKTRERARAANVAIKANERFGFSAYANTGPERELISAVFLQRLVAQYLIEALIDARPMEILTVQREWPATRAEREAREAAVASGQPSPALTNDRLGTDIFAIDRRITARVPGFVDAIAFRLTFQGHTAALRTFLNRLAAFEVPVVVRSVEVEPTETIAAAANAPAASAAASLASIFGGAGATGSAESVAEKPKPLVEKKLSRFTVTIEWIDLVQPAKAENAAKPTS